MNRLKRGLLLVSATTLLTTAQAREFAEIYTECGLGALIAPNTPAVAAVTNVTWDLGTTAISSNISSPETCKGGKEKTAAFIFKSYENLEKEIAIGSGKYLGTLIELSAKDNNRKEFITYLRNEFSKEIAKNGYKELPRYKKAEILYNIVINS